METMERLPLIGPILRDRRSRRVSTQIMAEVAVTWDEMADQLEDVAKQQGTSVDVGWLRNQAETCRGHVRRYCDD